MNSVFYYETNVGTIGIVENGLAITQIFYGKHCLKDTIKRETLLIMQAIEQINEYFYGKRQIFKLPLEPEGTEFQKRVWQELLSIPYGETNSYKEVAKKIGNPKASRAIGMANNKNPIAIVIPCHRVIGTNGSLTGYAGGIAVKEYLLQLEQKNISSR